MRNVPRFTLFCVALCAAVAGLAQTTNSGDIRGSVTVQSGTLIPDVTVTVPIVDTGVSKDYVAYRDGLRDTSSIVSENDKLTFTKAGFADLARIPIALQVGFTTVDVKLKAGLTTVQVTVDTYVPLLLIDTSEMTNSLEWELHS